MRKVIKQDWTILLVPLPILVIFFIFGVNALIMILTYVFCAGALIEHKKVNDRFRQDQKDRDK